MFVFFYFFRFIDISKITEVQDMSDSEKEKFCFNVVTNNRTYPEIKAKDNDRKLRHGRVSKPSSVLQLPFYNCKLFL